MPDASGAFYVPSGGAPMGNSGIGAATSAPARPTIRSMNNNPNPVSLPRSGRLWGPAVLVAGGLALLGGCSSDPESHVVSAPPPQVVVVQQPQMATPQGTIVVTQAPPAAPQMVYAQPARPTSDHVWVEGHWTIRDGRYAWVEARWEMPPRSDARWIAPRWERSSNGSYIFYEGYWN
jgi:hypothetical protein